MSLIRLNNVSKWYQDHLVLREIYFRLDTGDRVGLIGRNGTGKTTVLRLILGREEPTEGSVDINEGLAIGYFSQFSEIDGEVSIEETLEEVFSGVRAIETELDKIAGSLGATTGKAKMEQLLHRQAELFEQMERRDGWTYRIKIDTVLTRLGFSRAHRICPIDQLSGGWRNRAALAEILLRAPDVLLLDEPTNYLDIEGLQWLEEWCQERAGALIVVSHDRHFLDGVVNRVVEIENYHFQEYQGGFTEYVRQKPMRLKTLERQFEHEEELLALEAEAIVERNEAKKDPGKALKRRLANIKKRVAPRGVDRIITDIYQDLSAPNNLLHIDRVAKAYGDRLLFDQLTFDVHRGDRIAVIGPNGCGKTTLLRILLGDEPPDKGRIVWSKAAAYVYYDQVFEELEARDTVTHTVNVVGLAYSAPRKRVNRFLSLLGFSEIDLGQRIGTLSGGQKARVALAKCLLSGANVVVLDEPTNHLDMPIAQVMERALTQFPGAVIVASHDRFFIDKIATRLLAFSDDRIDDITGNWTIWQASLIKEPA